MCSYEVRIRAVELYIKLGKRVKADIRQLGYPTKNALKSWDREHERLQFLLRRCRRRPEHRACRRVHADPVGQQRVKVHVEVQRAARTQDQRHRAALTLATPQPALAEQKARYAVRLGMRASLPRNQGAGRPRHGALGARTCGLVRTVRRLSPLRS